MPSELLYAIKNKNKFEKEEAKRKKEELLDMRVAGLYRVALNKQLEIISVLFEDPNVKSVSIKVSEDKLIEFGKALGFEEMKEYDVTQYSSTEYQISRKVINI